MLLFLMRSISIITKMRTKSEYYNRLLWALGQRMEQEDHSSIGLVVCGGAALGAVGALERETLDVDVVALARNNRLVAANLPDSLKRYVREIAEEFGVSASWLNTGPRSLFEKGLPPGLQDRLRQERYGEKLSIFWIAREDLICLKLYAASDDLGRQRRDIDIQDFKALTPKFEEIDVAIKWLKTLPDYHEKSDCLKRLLLDEGHEDNAAYL